MPRPNVFPMDTKLWHPAEGWKIFPQGETDPGAAWHEREGGSVDTTETNTALLKDMIKFQDMIEEKDRVLASKDHDLAQMGKERDEAVNALSAAQQATRDAEAKQQDAEDAAAKLTVERDAARAALAAASTPEPEPEPIVIKPRNKLVTE